MKKIVILLALASGCAKYIEDIDAGKIVDIQPMTTSFNESIKTRVVTDKAVFIVYGSPSALT